MEIKDAEEIIKMFDSLMSAPLKIVESIPVNAPYREGYCDAVRSAKEILREVLNYKLSLKNTA